MPQSRAQGLTRAILDTFPIVKFGSPSPDLETGTKELDTTDSEPASPHQTNFEMKGLTHSDDLSPIHTEYPDSENVVAVQRDTEDPAGPSDIPAPRPRPPKTPGGTSVTVDGNEVMPASIGRETCPICIVDFEDGDDLRQLPCEGKHRFHQQCVDPWLLELSSSCPICRHGELTASLTLVC